MASSLTSGQLRYRQAQDESVKKAETETVIDMAELGARVAKRKAELGIVDPTDPALVKGRNSGERRTESKEPQAARGQRFAQGHRGSWREVVIPFQFAA